MLPPAGERPLTPPIPLSYDDKLAFPSYTRL